MTMSRHVVLSFYVSRPEDFPEAPDYMRMLAILDASCRRFGLEHVVLTDLATAPQVEAAGLTPFATDLPRNLLQAATECWARWMESPLSIGVDSVFVGADCIVIRDFRPFLKPADLSIILFRHKSLWIMTSFVHVPAGSRDRVRRTFRKVANTTHPLPARTCDDMMAWERVLAPKPPTEGLHDRRGLLIDFLEDPVWSGMPTSAVDPVPGSFVLHFRGQKQKPLFFDWAKANGFD